MGGRQQSTLQTFPPSTRHPRGVVYYPGKFHPGRWKITRPRFVHPSPLGPTEGGQNTHRLFHPDGWNFTPSGFLHLRGLEGGMIPTKLFHPHHLTTPHLDPPHLTSPITQWVEYYPPEFSTCITPPHFIWRKLYIDQQCNHIFNCETENEPKILYSVVYSNGSMLT